MPYAASLINFIAVFLATMLLVAGSKPASAEHRPPDIVVIVADDLGWGDLSCYGAADLTTPNLDRLASEGQSWNRFYANCCVCSPTRASILTGRYPDRVGVPGVIRTHPTNSWGKLADVPTLAETLHASGYQTACIGKWHLGLTSEDHPLQRGFDHFHGFLGDMMDDYYTHLRHRNNYMQHNRTEINPAGHATQLFTDWARRSIDLMASNDQPYFLYLAYNAPHTPIQPPPTALQRVQHRLPDTDPKRQRLVALIEDMDRGIGSVLAKIDEASRDTLVVFVSDNGGQTNVGANNGGLRNGKQSMYEGGLRIPAIFRWNNKIPAGSECQAIGVTMDLMPTLCEVAGVAAPKPMDGISLVPWLKTPDTEQQPREIYFVRREGGTRYAGLTIQALRQGNWKLVHNLPTQSFELFNLEQDPLEQHDLAKEDPRRLRQMIQKLQVHIQHGGAVPWQPTATP